MVKFGISIYGICRKIISGEMSAVQAYNRLCEMGAEVVELVPFGFNIAETPELIPALLEASEKAGVPIENYSLNANFTMLTDEEYAAEMTRVKKHIDAVNKMKIPTMRIDSVSFRRPKSENTMENFQKEIGLIVSTYEELCDYAAQYGMTILLENHGFHANGSERVRQILTSVDRKNFAHQLDVGNYTCVDDIPEIAAKKMVKFAKTVHMKDFYIRPAHRDPGNSAEFNCSNSWFTSTNGTFLRGSILAQGDIDIWDVIRTIKNSDFDGNIFVEYEGMEECDYGTHLSFANLKRIWNEV